MIMNHSDGSFSRGKKPRVDPELARRLMAARAGILREVETRGKPIQSEIPDLPGMNLGIRYELHNNYALWLARNALGTLTRYDIGTLPEFRINIFIANEADSLQLSDNPRDYLNPANAHQIPPVQFDLATSMGIRFVGGKGLYDGWDYMKRYAFFGATANKIILENWRQLREILPLIDQGKTVEDDGMVKKLQSPLNFTSLLHLALNSKNPSGEVMKLLDSDQ